MIINPLENKLTLSTLANIESILFKKNMDYRTINISGWAVDSNKSKAASAIYINIYGIDYKVDYDSIRPDVAYTFSNYEYLYTGFSCEIDILEIPDGKHIILLKIVNHEYTGYYEIPFEVYISRSVYRLVFEKIKIYKNILKNKLVFLKGFWKEKFFLLSIIKNIFYTCYYRLLNKKIIVINLDEHIGDIVACEPVSRILKKAYPEFFLVWITRYHYLELVENNPTLDNKLGLTCLYEWIVLKKLYSFLSIKIIDLHIDQRVCTSFKVSLHNPNRYGITLSNYYDYGTILEAFMMSANLQPIDIAPIFYVAHNAKTLFKIDGKYIVIHISSNEIEREMNEENWIIAIDFLISKGFSVVEIGLKSKINYQHVKFINLCGKHLFQDLALLIQKAELFVGIDSAFAHFANALSIPAVIFLGYYRTFKKYMPYSGKFKNGENATIVNYNGYLKNISPDIVIGAIQNQLLKRK